MSSDLDPSIGSLKERQTKSLSDMARELVRVLFSPLARWADQVGISANAVTVFGFILNALGGVALALGRFYVGAALIALGGTLDGLDGLIARAAGKVTPFGAFLDSVLDRWSEVMAFGGLLFWYTHAGKSTEVFLIYVALASSLLVSYTRARAEGIGAQCKGGAFTRLERVIVFVAGLILDQMTIALWILAVFATLTALQRIYLTWKYIKNNL